MYGFVVCYSSCNRDAIKQRVRRYLADNVEHQKHVADIAICQFTDKFLVDSVDSITVYDLTAVIQVIQDSDLCNEKSTNSNPSLSPVDVFKLFI